MTKNKLEEYNCPIGTTLRIIGGKYKVIIIWLLYQNKILRYSELQRNIKGVTPKISIAQLRELESDKIIERKVYPVVPPKVEYSLTPKGESLIPVLLEMNKWGEQFIQE